MTKKKKTGGRVAGTPNKATAVIRLAIEAANPIAFMSDVMNGRMPLVDAETGEPNGEYEVANQQSRMRAGEFLAKRVCPEVKENPVQFSIGEIDSTKDAMRAIGQVTEAIANGEILPSEGRVICDMISTFIKVYEVNELTKRLDDIETTIEKST